MSTGINVTKRIKILDEGVLLTSDVSQIDFTGGVTATTSGNNVTVNVPAAGITVGTTPVTSGTDTRVFFQAGGVVQQDANFTFNNTQKRLTLKAVGTAATDIPFAVQNSAGTSNLLQVSGNAITLNGVSGTAFTPTIALQRGGSNVFVIDEYASKFTGGVHINSLIAPGSGGISITNQSGSNKLIYILPTDGKMAIGYTTTTTNAALDVKAQGALSTDIAFRVRNSADTYNIVDTQGDSITNFRVNSTVTASSSGINLLGTNTDVIINAKATNTSGSNTTGFFASGGGGNVGLYTDYGAKIVSTGAGVLQHSSGANNGRMNFVSGTNTTGWSFMYNTATTFGVANTVFGIYPTNAQSGGGTLALGTTLGTTVSSLPAATYGKNTFFIANGTAPTTTGTDSFALYSADITAGNAAPHFRTENGAIVKVYQETTAVAAATLVSGLGTPLTDTDTFDGYTLKQIVKALRNQGLLA